MRPAGLFISAAASLGAIFVALLGISSPALAAQSEILRETDSELEYLYDGIPYPIRQDKDSGCGFTERELEIMREALTVLPEVYLDLPEEFRIEKKCELKGYKKRKRVRAAYTYPGKIVFSDQAFAFIKEDGKTYAINPELSRKTVTHEFTHVLDRNYGLSSQASFRQINHWARNWAFMLKADPVKSEGFYRDQGKSNPQEDLATAAEGYFFDPSFICNQPAMYAWFSSHVGPTLVDRVDCPGLNEPLDPRTVTAVGYMFISATDDHLESKFGHSLLHFHDSDGDAYNDVLIQAAGNYPGQPVYTGSETPEELQKKQSQRIEVSRLGFLLKGVTNGLDFVVAPVRYKAKWLETVVLEGRDIREKILKLDRDQLRAMVYMVNRDVQRALGKYRFFKNNCATYVGETINKVLATDLIHKNWMGSYTPRGVWNGVDSVTAAEAPVVEGDMSRLARLLPRRAQHSRDLRESDAATELAAIDWSALEKVKGSGEAADRASAQLDALVDTLARLSESGRLSPAVQKSAQGLVYTFTVEKNLRLKGHALQLYKQLARMKAIEQVPAAPAALP